MDRASVLIDPSISKIDILHISRDGSSDFATLRDFCLSGEKLPINPIVFSPGFSNGVPNIRDFT